jgi:hypothetical protein
MGSLRSLPMLLLVAALALGAGTGCFLDEIDKSMELYPGQAAKTRAKEAEKAEAAAAGQARASASRSSGPSWWETARTIGPELRDETITRCALDGRTEFMRRDNCLARGGRPQ